MVDSAECAFFGRLIRGLRGAKLNAIRTHILRRRRRDLITRRSARPGSHYRSNPPLMVEASLFTRNMDVIRYVGTDSGFVPRAQAARSKRLDSPNPAVPRRVFLFTFRVPAVLRRKSAG